MIQNILKEIHVSYGQKINLSEIVSFQDLLKSDNFKDINFNNIFKTIIKALDQLEEMRVKEGERERLQAFEGVVIAVKNRGINSSFTVRKISHGEGVERVFQTHSPLIAGIELKRRGKVRRSKLYYLRELSGKAARIKEKLAPRK